MKNFETWDEAWAELKEKYPEGIAEAEKIKEEMEKEEETKKRRQKNENDEAVVLGAVLLRMVGLKVNPFPFDNLIDLILTKKEFTILGDCIYKYLGEHYPESSIARIQRIVKETKE